MPKKKSISKKVIKKSERAERIVLRTGEALVEAEPAYSAAEPEVVIGELDGPVGFAIANLIGDQSRGHSRVFAILNCDGIFTLAAVLSDAPVPSVCRALIPRSGWDTRPQCRKPTNRRRATPR